VDGIFFFRGPGERGEDLPGDGMRSCAPAERPQGVRLLAILLLLGAVKNVAELASEPMASGGRDAAHHAGNLTLLLLYFGLPVGIWCYQRWPHALLVLGLLVGVLSSLISAATVPGHVESWLQGIVSAGILWYLLVPRVRAAFWGRGAKGDSGVAVNET